MILIAFLLQNQARMQLRFATNRLRSEQCQGAAEAGLQLALTSLSANSAYSGQESALTLGEGPETYSIKILKSPSSMPDGQALPAGCWYVLATGRSKNLVAYSGALVKVVAGGAKGLPGAFGTSVKMTNSSVINSYDSRNGFPKNFQSKATVVTNSEGRGAVDLGNKSKVQGTILVGPDGLIETGTLRDADTSGSAYTIWRDRDDSYVSAGLQTTPLDMPEVTLPSAPGTTDLAVNQKNPTLAPGNYDKVTISNNVHVVLQPGVYVFDTLVLSNGGSIQLASRDQPVKIFIKTKFDLNNSFDVSSPAVSPRLLQINLAPGASYDQSGSSTLTGIVYGPGARFKLSNSSDLYGSAVGGEMSLSNSASLHYDEALSDYSLETGGPSGGTAGVNVLFRQRW